MTSFRRVEDFNRALEEFEDSTVPLIAKEVQKTLVIEIYKRIVLTTPVLTGRARRNWTPTIGTPSNFSTEDVAGVLLTGAPVTQDEKSRIKSVISTLNALPLGQTVWISNNLPYIRRLDNGYSQKAPSGITEVSIFGALEAQKMFKGVVIN